MISSMARGGPLASLRSECIWARGTRPVEAHESSPAIGTARGRWSNTPMPAVTPLPVNSPVSDAEALDWVCQLMALPGASGSEGAVMAWIADRLRAEGLPKGSLRHDSAHKRSAHGGEIGNAILALPGRRGAPRRLLTAHADTVPICVGSKPRVKGGLVESSDPATGLGADDRAGTAVLLATAIGLLRSGATHPPVTFAWLVQEEVGMYGARNLATGWLGSPKLCFNFDGGSPSKLTVGATGGYRMEITVSGVPSHAGVAPEKGVSAVAIASLAVADLVENGWHGLVEKKGKRGTSNVGVIRGGAATNVVTDRVTLRAEARSHDRPFRERIVREIESAFRRAAKRVVSSEGKRGSVAFDGRLDYEAFRLREDDPSLAAATATLQELGVEPVLAVTDGGLDANWLAHHGLPAVSIGCGQRNIHTVEERLDIAEFQFARELAWRLATR